MAKAKAKRRRSGRGTRFARRLRNLRRPGAIPTLFALLPDISVGAGAVSNLADGVEPGEVGRRATRDMVKNYLGLWTESGKWDLFGVLDSPGGKGFLPVGVPINYGMKVGAIIISKVGKKLKLDRLRLPFIGRLF